MPQLQIPLTIWAAATSAERDQFYLDAGFSPLFPVVDNGTDNFTVRFRQDVPFTGDFNTDAPGIAPTPLPVAGGNGTLQAGDDLRDVEPVSLTGDNPITDEFGVAPSGATALAIAGRALRLVLGGGGGRLTAAIWNSLPSIVRSALLQVGIGVGALIAFNGDIPFITLPGQGGPSDPLLPMPTTGPGAVDIQVGATGHLHALGVTIVGSWNTNPKDPANGVIFYRLSDGKLAVMNKKGRWKVWKPRKPIVLYADGASNIKTMLRADRALAKQAKKIAAMLNRRAPRSKKSSPKSPIIIESGPGNVITRA